MTIEKIKSFLSKDAERIIRLLQHYGFHTFSYSHDNLRCAVPDGDNPSSVSIYLDDQLYGTVYTRGNVKGDIFHIIETVTDIPLRQILNTTRILFKLPGSRVNHVVIDDVLLEMKKYSRKQYEVKENKLYDAEVFLGDFVQLPHYDLIKEGISPQVSDKYSICYDPYLDRIVFPHFDWIYSNKIVGAQGRIVGMDTETAKLLGVAKYWNYILGYRKSLNLYGWHLAKDNILKHRKLIIFEGEKSVLKQSTFEKGEGYAVALGGSELSLEQLRFIIRNTPNDCEVIIALDRDIMYEEKEYLLNLCERVAQYRKTSYIYDKAPEGELLKKKDAPVDGGYKTWKYLLENRVEYSIV